MVNEQYFRQIILDDETLVIECALEELEAYDVIEIWSSRLLDVVESFSGRYLILDFHLTQVITTVAISRFLFLKVRARERGIALGLCGLNNNSARKFYLTSLERAFIIGKEAADTLVRLKVK